MNGELLSTQTEDGLTLHGMLLHGEKPPNRGCDLLIFVHGVGSNFYQSSLIRKSWRLFAEAGISLLSINTRGHDFVFAGGMAKSQSWYGSANEIVDECILDLDAWVNRASRLGFERISLYGHSLGAIKAVYSQSVKRNPAVQSVIAVSPSCLSCSYFQQSERAEEFQTCLSWAEDQVEAGNSAQISEVTFPFRLMMSPRTFLDKYGPAERYNILNLVGRITQPLCVVFGELEVAGNNPAFEQLDQRIRPEIDPMENATLQLVSDADHYYSGVQNDLAHLVTDWVNKL